MAAVVSKFSISFPDERLRSILLGRYKICIPSSRIMILDHAKGARIDDKLT